jgi:excinuclease ABC subunit B
MLELIKQLESDMKAAAKNLEFEKAAIIRDRITELRRDEGLLPL